MSVEVYVCVCWLFWSLSGWGWYVLYHRSWNVCNFPFSFHSSKVCLMQACPLTWPSTACPKHPSQCPGYPFSKCTGLPLFLLVVCLLFHCPWPSQMISTLNPFCWWPFTSWESRPILCRENVSQVSGASLRSLLQWPHAVHAAPQICEVDQTSNPQTSGVIHDAETLTSQSASEA